MIRAVILGLMARQCWRHRRAPTCSSTAPDQHIGCGEDIKTADWYQSFSGGPHNATIQILSARKLVVFSRHVRATTTWRYWTYHPRCGRTYFVRYVSPGGPPYTARVHVDAARARQARRRLRKR